MIARDRYDELLDFGFSERQADAMSDAGLVLEPGRFPFSAAGVNALHLIPAKRVHDGLLPETSAAPAADRRVT